jgi:hypothetical protein
VATKASDQLELRAVRRARASASSPCTVKGASEGSERLPWLQRGAADDAKGSAIKAPSRVFRALPGRLKRPRLPRAVFNTPHKVEPLARSHRDARRTWRQLAREGRPAALLGAALLFTGA